MSVPPEKNRLRILVSGRVQGVSFRYYTRNTAERLGLTGFVRNLPDGRVEIEAEGDPEALERMREWAGCGPSSARVDKTRIERLPPRGGYRSFDIIG